MAITAQFSADFTDFQRGVQAAETSLGGLETKTETVASTIEATLTSMNLRQLVGDVKAIASEFIGAYAQEEEATNKLILALKNQGLASDDVVKGYQDMASQFQATTSVSDDAILSMMGLLTTVGTVGPEQMQTTLMAVTNLASGMAGSGMSLETATMMVAKAFATGDLGKLKTILGDTVPKGADMATVLQAINDKFGGQATGDLETYNGAMQNLANRMDDAKENMGGLLLSGLQPLLEIFSALPTPLQDTALGFVSIGSALAPLALSVAPLVPLITSLAGALGITMAGALATLGALLLPAGLIIAGITAVYLAFKHWDTITAIVQAVYEGIKLWLVDRFRALVGLILSPIDAVVGGFKALYDKVVGHSYVPDLITGIATEFAKLDAVMVAPAQKAATDVEAALLKAKAATTGGGSAAGLGGSVAGLAPTWSQSLVPRYGAGGYIGTGAPVNITINGSVLGNKDEIARVVGDAVTSSYRSGGNRLPV